MPTAGTPTPAPPPPARRTAPPRAITAPTVPERGHHSGLADPWASAPLPRGHRRLAPAHYTATATFLLPDLAGWGVSGPGREPLRPPQGRSPWVSVPSPG